jgi:hypothetical protein
MSDYTNWPNGITVAGVPTMGMSGIPLTSGNIYFADYVNGSDGNPGTAAQPMKTIYRAYAACRDGYNDTVVIVGNGQASGSQRLSVANAVAAAAVTGAAVPTTGTLAWDKNACHLIGMSSASPNSRARIAPPTGTYTMATFGSGNFVTMAGSGCTIANIALFNGFSTGGSAQICWTASGSRNNFVNVQFGGAGDAASAQSTSSRSLKVSGGENRFDTCQIGLDTVTKTVANASLELASGAARNEFWNCNFPFYTSSATTIGIIGTGASCIDRTTLFRGCTFGNAAQSGSTTMSGLATLPASAGGLLLMKDCTLVGISEFGTDATTRGQIYVDGAAATAGTSGIAVNPT